MSVIVSLIVYRHDKLMIDYIIADDYTYVVSSYDESTTFSHIEKLPDSVDEEFGATLWEGCLENDKSIKANCYKYEYNGLEYLKVEIYDNKFIDFDTDSNNEKILYYVENT